MKKIISEQLRKQLEKFSQGNNIFVLKGIPIEFIGEKIFPENLEQATADPLAYFFELRRCVHKEKVL